MSTLDPLYGAVPPGGYVLKDSNEDTASVIVCYAGQDEMLKICKDGFWVRGVKVPQDDKEAEIVYNSFLQWMSYMALTRNY